MAELLTTNKLSELACLTLYLMYEKKNGRQSVWYEFIKARGPRLSSSCTLVRGSPLSECTEGS
jgi:hypothetical protein